MFYAPDIVGKRSKRRHGKKQTSDDSSPVVSEVSDLELSDAEVLGKH